MKFKNVSIYSFLHLLVDFSCAITLGNCLCNSVDSADTFSIILLYNFCAFVLQLPFGVFADHIGHNAFFSALGCLLVAIGIFLSNFASIPIYLIVCVIIGIGNALFHIGGGIDILNISQQKATPIGIFVSTGALGLFLGSNPYILSFLNRNLLIPILCASTVFLLLFYDSIQSETRNTKFAHLKLTRNELISIIFLIATVCIRGYVSLTLGFDWKNNFAFACAAIFAVVFGKMLGGMFGDKIGFLKTSMFSLGISAFCFIFAFDNSILGVIAILLFNMTMPLTLTAVANILKNKGLAFGLLTVALFIGAIPVLLGLPLILFNPIGLFVISSISLIFMFIGLRYQTIEK